MDEQIEIDLGLLRKTEKRVWVKPTSKKKGHYRKIKGAKEIEKAKPEKSYLTSKFENRFGAENMNKYSKYLSSKNDEELIKEFGNLTLDDKEFFHKFIMRWFEGGMRDNDGWITKELKLSTERSRWNKNLLGDAETPGKIDSFMKFYLLNQEYLKRKFSNGKVVLYRGLVSEQMSKFEEGSIIEVNGNNLSSWTEIYDLAEFFSSDTEGGVVLKIEVPIEDILMTTRLVGEYDDGNDPTEVILAKENHKAKVILPEKYEQEMELEDIWNKIAIKWGEIK